MKVPIGEGSLLVQEEVSSRLSRSMLKSPHRTKCPCWILWIRFSSYVRNIICRELGTYTFTNVNLVLSKVQSRTMYLPSVSTRLSCSVKEVVLLIAFSTQFFFDGTEALKM